MSPPFTRRQYSGGAVATTVNGGLTNTTAVFDVADGTTYPSATFFCVLDEGLSTEEKIFVASRSGNTFSSVLRGEDGTTALPHSAGSTIRHVFVAQDADEANVVATVLTVKGDILARTATGPGRAPIGAAGTYLVANPSQPTGLDWTTAPLEVSDFDARGDLLVATGDNAMVRLPVGANGTVLTADTLGFPATFLGYAPPITSLTTAQITALTGAALWDGRVVYNTTVESLMVYNLTGTAWRGTRSRYVGATGTGNVSVASTTEVVTATIIFPDQACAGTLTVWAQCYLTKTTPSDRSWMYIREDSIAGAVVGQSRADDTGINLTNLQYQFQGAVNMVAGSAKTVVLTIARQTSAGTYTWFADPSLHRLDAVFTPTP